MHTYGYVDSESNGWDLFEKTDIVITLGFYA